MAKKRERIQNRLDEFHDKAFALWAPEDDDDEFDAASSTSSGYSSADSDGADDFFLGSRSEITGSEVTVVVLPSTLGAARCQELGYAYYAAQELELRNGQANDALQGLRLAISRKSVVYREGLRKSKSKVKKSRSWDEILVLDKSVRHHARIYRAARDAMIRLGASEEDLVKYRVLDKSHLGVSTATIDPSLRGHRNTSLAWFWTMDVEGDIQGHNGMEECEYIIRF